ncbi:VCBS repeat-containing protein [Algoriphagus sp. H41]|uniref:VCBS repeat-containing protein n=1 Tax=Algoriphagus oliviformis TaxID=2811231 RepID=A0ABS3C9Z0_9BACT|nr:VCBS repeat-containing protein [Algoriphagus oliviformis]MBN7812439.1 VCBS repeat-containing protein [Algoriphagus oliviformis]
MKTPKSPPIFLGLLFFIFQTLISPLSAQEIGEFQLVKYNNPGATSYVGVGLWAWPLPMDYDGDGDMDLLVSCPDKPFNGLYLFENKSGESFPVFEPPVRLGPAISQIQVSHTASGPRFLVPGAELKDFAAQLDQQPEALFPKEEILKDFQKNPRFNQWKMADYDGDGDEDILVGIDDWSDYGWDNAFNSEGKWTNGPLHGYVYWLENKGGSYENRGRIQVNGQDLDVYGAPSPNLADFDGDGDLDLITGEFLDKMTYFQNVGTRNNPRFSEGKLLGNKQGTIKMDLEMIIPVALDWDGDGWIDLVVGDEDGRVALVRNTGKVKEGTPVFDSPKYFRQKADNLKFGALVTPVSYDWDQDGDLDIVAGNSAGYLCWIENLKDGPAPQWAEPELLEVGGKPFRVQAGDNGSIQGPAEAKWGYTTLSVADWDGDGKGDLVINSIWGKVEWLKNAGKGKLQAPQPVDVAWGNAPIPAPAWNWWKPAPTELATQWRTTPYAIDWNQDGLMDLVMLDHEGYLAFFERKNIAGKLMLTPGQRIFYGENASVFGNKNEVVDETPGLLRLNNREAGGSGRRKLSFLDWDNDGDMDLLVNSINVSLFEQTKTEDGKVYFRSRGQVAPNILAGHTTSPTFVDWNKNGVWDVLVGAEDGHFYYLAR